jgi:hypothetical protein
MAALLTMRRSTWHHEEEHVAALAMTLDYRQ